MDETLLQRPGLGRLGSLKFPPTVIASITFYEWVFGVGFFVSTAGFIVTLLRWRVEIAEKRVEKQKRKNLEDQLLSNRRRAEAPYLVASSMWADGWGQSSTGAQLTKSPGMSFTLDNHPEQRSKVLLAARNQGQHVRCVVLRKTEEITLDALRNEITAAGNDSRCPLFTYYFDKQKLGQEMRFALAFESLDGFQQEHLYQTRHGVCELRRIDPT